MSSPQRALVGALGLGLTITGLTALAPSARADVSDSIPLPYDQEWTDAGLISADDSWSGVTGVQGYRGDNLTASTGVDPQTILADGSGVTDVIANATSLNGVATGGVAEGETVQTIAMQGSGTADAPNVVFRLDLTGEPAATFAFDAKDVDGSADDAAQQIAVQYRIGGTGDYTNLPDGFVADATEPNAASKVTPVSVTLPGATAGEAAVYVRVITTNANGSDEWVGIDNIDVSTGGDPGPLTVTDPADVAAYVDTPITPFQLEATGGDDPYTWEGTGLPAGITVSTGGEVSGTPTEVGTFDATVTATDSVAATDSETVTFEVTEEPDLTPIHEIQGTGDRSPFAPDSGSGAGDVVTTQGVVTAMYADPYPVELGTNGGLDGMYIQTAGTGGTTDGTPGASDAVFVFGANAMPAGVEIGDSVEVTGTVSEFNGITEITPDTGGVTELGSPLAAVTPYEIAYPTTEETREDEEGMLLAPTDTLTVSNAFTVNQFGEIGLATGDHPLVQPTEVAGDEDAAGLAAVKADNEARKVALDDATSINYLSNGSPQQDLPVPWLTKNQSVRVGAEVTLLEPVILEFRNNIWKFQPQTPVTDAGTDVASFEDTRADNLTPQSVGGDVQIATFNVLNYFNTTGQQYVANGAAQNPPVNTQCTFFNDRDGNPIGNNTCGIVTNGVNAGNGPRGAATTVSFQRQQAKIVRAINALGADIVGLEEIENSMKLVGETNRDDAVAALVAALNADAGAGTWAYVKSPGEALNATNIGFQDVIRPAFIYKPAQVRPVGQSDIYFEESANATLDAPAGAFANAREPLAQAFKPTGAADSEAFAVIVNHFKSKGDSTPPATGDNANSPDTGAFNGDRVRQATKLAEFAQAFADARDIEAVFIAGDLNSYSEEDPIHVLEGAGYTRIESSTPGEESYSFSGLSGSLDHILGNDAAMSMVTGADIWDINASESIGYQYSRFNYNVTELFDATNPFAASDHNPEIVGLDVPDFTPDPTTKVQILGTNDFHGRLLLNGQEGGAAILSGAVDELRGEYPNTVFAAAGDLIGASTFESFIQDDKPTIDALNEAGLEVSAVGNHELDQGYDDLVNRVMAPYDPTTNPLGGAEWEYIAANIDEPGDQDKIAETWTQDFGDIRVGFVGAVTEDLPALVSPDGIQGLTVTDIVDATNAAAADLKGAGGADLVVMLVHEGSPSTSCSSMTDPATTWGNIVNGVDANVDAIVSGHTHLAYNCAFEVPEWVDENRAVTERPVVSAGQYGSNLNQLVFSVDANGDVVALSQELVGLGGVGWTPDPAVTAIVDDAVAEANVLGAEVLGQIEGPFNRAKLANGSTENRGGESTLGNLVAEVQRWATDLPETGNAEIAFMNPGGLRADMTGTINGSARDLTYKQAAVVQPFANTLVNMDLTGAQIETALEQQWQRDGAGRVPSRPFLRLGVSDGFTYTYDEVPVTVQGVNTFQGEITGMWLDGEPIDPASTYSVTVNSFLASGGDNFREFANGTGRADTGKVDLAAMVDYLDAFASTEALPVDYGQRAVEVSFPNDAPGQYAPGDHVVFDVASWAMSTNDDLEDAQLEVKLGGETLGTFPVDNTIGTAVFDTYGTAHVDVVLPEVPGGGPQVLTLSGPTTGTVARVPIDLPVEPVAEVAVDDVNVAHGEDATAAVQVSGNVETPTGTVEVYDGETLLGTGTLNGFGAVNVVLDTSGYDPGTYELSAEYLGNGTYAAASAPFTLTVGKAAPTVTADDVTITYPKAGTVGVTVDGGDFEATGTVTVKLGSLELAPVTLEAGVASVPVPKKWLDPGIHVVSVVYSGDANLAAATGFFTMTVEKGASKTKLTVAPDDKVEKGTTLKFTAEVSGPDGVEVTGKVRFRTGDQTVTVDVVNGKAVWKKTWKRVGEKTVRAVYLGNDFLARSNDLIEVKIVR